MSDATPQIELHVGQAVRWPPAPHQLAQVEQLGRTRVVLVYQCRTGRWRHPVVNVQLLVYAMSLASQPVLPLSNPMGRGVRPKSKTYSLERTLCQSVPCQSVTRSP